MRAIVKFLKENSPRPDRHDCSPAPQSSPARKLSKLNTGDTYNDTILGSLFFIMLAKMTNEHRGHVNSFVTFLLCIIRKDNL